jgi:hypothetical protein
MKLNDLKLAWQNAGGEFKSKTELSDLTRITHHPTLKKIRRRLIAETIFLLFFLVIYYDWFDGDQKPLYANLVLVLGLLLYIGNDVIGYISIANPIHGSNLKLSISSYFSRIKLLAVFSLAFSFLYSICLMVFFTSVIHFTREKRFLLVALAIILFQLIFWSFRVWSRRIKSLQEQVKDFDTDENK